MAWHRQPAPLAGRCWSLSSNVPRRQEGRTHPRPPRAADARAVPIESSVPRAVLGLPQPGLAADALRARCAVLRTQEIWSRFRLRDGRDECRIGSRDAASGPEAAVQGGDLELRLLCQRGASARVRSRLAQPRKLGRQLKLLNVVRCTRVGGLRPSLRRFYHPQVRSGAHLAVLAHPERSSKSDGQHKFERVRLQAPRFERCGIYLSSSLISNASTNVSIATIFRSPERLLARRLLARRRRMRALVQEN